MLHAAHGMDIGKHGASIAQLNLTASLDPVQPSNPTDIEVC